MDTKTLKREISDKIYSHSSSTSLYRNTYNEFNKTIDPYKMRDENFFLSKPQFALVAKNWNIETNRKTIDKLYDTIKPNATRISYNQLVTKLVN